MVKSKGATPGAILSATPGATPRQRPVNGGATHTPYTPSVAPALGGWVRAANGGRHLVPMPDFWERGVYAERGFPFALRSKGHEIPAKTKRALPFADRVEVFFKATCAAHFTEFSAQLLNSLSGFKLAYQLHSADVRRKGQKTGNSNGRLSIASLSQSINFRKKITKKRRHRLASNRALRCVIPALNIGERSDNFLPHLACLWQIIKRSNPSRIKDNKKVFARGIANQCQPLSVNEGFLGTRLIRLELRQSQERYHRNQASHSRHLLCETFT